MLTPRHLTDHSLLALAAAQRGRLATFDRGNQITAVPATRPFNLLMLAVESS